MSALKDPSSGWINCCTLICAVAVLNVCTSSEALAGAVPTRCEESVLEAVVATNHRHWKAGFDLVVEREAVLVRVNINLIAVGLATARELSEIKPSWKRAIEKRWDGRVAIERSDGQRLPVRVTVSFRGPAFHHRVLVDRRQPAIDQLHWSVATRLEDIAHEFGHMLGAYDEYVGGGNDPSDAAVIEVQSLMGHAPHDARAQPRHFWLVVDALSRRCRLSNVAVALTEN